MFLEINTGATCCVAETACREVGHRVLATAVKHGQMLKSRNVTARRGPLALALQAPHHSSPEDRGLPQSSDNYKKGTVAISLEGLFATVPSVLRF